MSETLYPTHSGRPQSQAQDLTPYSAVSSFNLPAHYDSTLITPVSLTSSPSMPTKSAPAMKQDIGIKLSPATMSPAYHMFCGDAEFASPRYNPPMKLKDPSGILQISAVDSSFPASPYVCSSPYYGAFGVSATSVRTTNSSPNVNASPHLQSAGGLSSTDSHHSRQQTPASFRSNFQAPILIAPNPQSLRPATNYGPQRQNSLHSPRSTHSPPQFQGPRQGNSSDNLGSMPLRGKKRKDPPSNYEEIICSGDISPEEQLLLELSCRDKLPWKEVAAKFNQETRQTKRVAALQMRKKRLLERLRVWTDAEDKTLKHAHDDYENNKWSSISNGTVKHDTQEKWSKEALQKKWTELHPGQSSYNPDYEVMPRNRDRVSEDLSVDDFSTGNSCWSDEGDSSTHSLHECDNATLMSALSTATMDEARQRALSNANNQNHLRQQQQQMMFNQHHQQQQQQRQQQQQNQHHHQNGWDSGP
ncbi:hypothetical protein NA56DRAFT_572842 [Hyaloscypha hepaticicola]|uniref:Myb-like domain-containing protein n=1 Tax=Hyaloscypha hepaticicola TaxID=2082293 RepID=A0A2J6Q3Q4_9HELO|nr:hypothetical protein NA56DRAFT_572842 [Hyaloscypha hepaticicola]